MEADAVEIVMPCIARRSVRRIETEFNGGVGQVLELRERAEILCLGRHGQGFAVRRHLRTRDHVRVVHKPVCILVREDTMDELVGLEIAVLPGQLGKIDRLVGGDGECEAEIVVGTDRRVQRRVISGRGVIASNIHPVPGQNALPGKTGAAGN